MPSHLRLQTTFDEPFVAETSRHHLSASASPPLKKQKMSLTQTYYIAASARSKLGREACRPDHNLRLLVGHANLLDSLMLELADAEREQEAWFNQTVSRASKAEESRHISWADTIVESPDEDMEDDDSSVSDSDSECDDDDFEMLPTLHKLRPSPVQITTTELYSEDEEDEEFYEDLEDDEEHALTRIASNSPPELVIDDESDDESMPPSPPQPSMEYPEVQQPAISNSPYYEEKPTRLTEKEQAAFLADGYFIPQRNSPMIASC